MKHITYKSSRYSIL